MAPAVASVAEQRAGPLINAVPENGAILDVGCGGGQMICVIKKLRPDLRAWGIDLSKQQVIRARKRTKSLGDAVDIKEGSALQMPYDSGCFDLVVSIASIKHWPDRARGLRECVRVLKPGGRLFVSEVDKEFDRAAGMEFVGNWRIPFFLRPVALRFFTRYVADPSLGLDEAKMLAAQLPATEATASKTDGLPVWEIRVTK
ncbi:MAG: class I SAM-dependent methyltransferase [Elusimicrobia bacterium]|nr:class I SAM-dependent methyltransferase [Elusimicrobiota bacterium]